MKAGIRDDSAFAQLNPADVANWLHSTGWKKRLDRPGHSSVWLRDYRGETAELLLPVDRSVPDYLLRMTEAVELIAAIEERPEAETLSDLQTAGADVLRVRFLHADAADGSISLDQGEKLVESAREILLAAGVSVDSPRAWFGSARTEEVRRFVRNLRLGPSERGSYVLTIRSSVAPRLRPEQESLFGEPEAPFERKAILQLRRALLALLTAARSAASGASAKVFQDAVRDGVSANLCSALVSMNGDGARHSDELRFGFSFALSRPNVDDLPREVAFPADYFPIIAEAARVLRATAPLEDQEIQGYVVKLQSRDDGGIATVSAVIDGQARKVTVALPHAEHTKAILAYEKRTEIVCRGDLTRSGQLWALLNPGRVELLADEDG